MDEKKEPNPIKMSDEKEIEALGKVMASMIAEKLEGKDEIEIVDLIASWRTTMIKLGQQGAVTEGEILHFITEWAEVNYLSAP